MTSTRFRLTRVRLREEQIGFLYVLPALIILLALTLYPFIYCINLSLQRWNLYAPEDRSYVGFANYINLFTSPDFWNAVRVTLVFTVVSVTVSFLLGLMLASLLAGRGRTVGILRTIFVMPMILTPIVAGTGFKFMYDPTTGIINYILGLAGINAPAWTTNPSTALLSVILVDIWQWTPFMFLILLAGIQGLPKAPYEAAACDGVSQWQILRFLTYPLLKPVILVALLFRAIDSFRTFDTIFAVTGGGPGSVTTTLNILAYVKGFRMFKMGEAAAIAIVIWAIVFIFSQLAVKYLGSNALERRREA